MLTSVFLRAARAATHVKCFLLSFLPSVILEVTYIDPVADSVTTQYNAVASYFNWSRNYQNYLMDNTGYYAFTVWNSHLQTKESYFLSAQLLCRAFHLKTLYSFWAYRQAGVVEILNQFMECNRSECGDLFAILTSECDISSDSQIAPFMKTLALPENATPRAILLYYKWLKEDRGDYTAAEAADFSKDSVVTVYDSSLDEREVDLNEHFFVREKVA